MQEDIGCTGATANFIARIVITEAKRLGSAGEVKRHSKNDLTRHATPRTMCPLHHRIRQLYPK
jgi:hypothetical protein